MRRGILLLLMLAVAACAPQNGDANATPAPRPGEAESVRVRGTVAVVGSAPVNTAVVIRGANGESRRVEGPLAAEIGRLAGAEVEVVGTRQRDPMYGEAVLAASYQIRGVDGRSVITGVVERGADGQLHLRAEDGTLLRLAGGTAQLRPGQKVWVEGPATVQVQSFGVIRP
jgi:hypothetical protein